MTDKMCDVCGKKIAMVHIDEQGDFCFDCYNAHVLKRYGMEDTFQYEKSISVFDDEGTMHTFQITHMIHSPIVSWDAIEENGNYHFYMVSNINENGTAVAERLMQKIIDGVNCKTLSASTCYTSNLLYRNDEWLSLKEKGTIRIIENEERGESVGFEIDGKKFCGEDLEQLLGEYPGFILQYQIQDASEPLLKEDEYLVPVKITGELLVEELETALRIHGDRGFVSYKNVFALSKDIDSIIDKLEVLARHGKRDPATSAAKEMIQVLKNVETDDDFFPQYEIDRIAKTVDPYRADAELNALMQNEI